MSSGVKGLIAGVAVLALLGGGVAAMKLTEPKNDSSGESSVSSETEEKAIYSGNADDIKSIEVTNDNGGFTIKRTAAASGDTGSKFAVEGLENIKTDDSVLSNFAPNAASLDAVTVIEENCSDPARFGLAEPAATAVITFDGESKQTVTLLVGNDTPGGYVYVKLKDSDTVYSVTSSFVKSYLYEKEYFVSRTVLEEPAEDESVIVKTLKVERPDLEKPIIFEYTGENESGGTTATHVMTSPVNSYLDVSKSVNYTHGIFGLNAASVLSVSPSEEELSFSGIDTPSCTVTMTLEDGSEYVLKTGIEYSSSEDTLPGYIGYFEGTDILWKFNAEDVPWVTMKPEDAMSMLVFGSYIYDLKGLEINAGSTSHKFDFEGSDADSYKVKLDGKEFDTERYKSFYQALIKAPAEEICTSDEGIGSLLVSCKLTYNNGKPAETIEFYEAENRKVIIKKNGETCFKCRLSFVEKALLPNIANISGDTDFVTNW